MSCFGLALPALDAWRALTPLDAWLDLADLDLVDLAGPPCFFLVALPLGSVSVTGLPSAYA